MSVLFQASHIKRARSTKAEVDQRRVGLHVSGPFAIRPGGATNDLRLSCWAMINPTEKRRPKSKTKIRAEARMVSDEAETAPNGTGEDPNDAIGF